MEIGNAVGWFVYLDSKVLGARDKRVARILVEVEFFGDLFDTVILEWVTLCFNQRIKYRGILFRCILCHHTGHLLERCPSHFLGSGDMHWDGNMPYF